MELFDAVRAFMCLEITSKELYAAFSDTAEEQVCVVPIEDWLTLFMPMQ